MSAKQLPGLNQSSRPPDNTNAGVQVRQLSKNRKKFRKAVDFGNAAGNCFDMEQPIRYLYVEDDLGDGGVKAIPTFLVDPCQGGATPLKTATVQQNPGDALSPTLFSHLATMAVLYCFNGSTFNRVGSPGQFDSGGSNQAALVGVNRLTTANSAVGSATDYSMHMNHTVSALGTAQTWNLDVRAVAKTLAISSVASAGTATLVISVSADNTNFLTIDSLAAAASQIKQYTEGTIGASTALSPLAFRYIKIVAGSAGAGNTTTLDIGLK